MGGIDEQYLKTPFYGSRRMTAVLQRTGESVNRDQVLRLIRLMGLEGLFPGRRTTVATTRDEALSVHPSRSDAEPDRRGPRRPAVVAPIAVVERVTRRVLAGGPRAAMLSRPTTEAGIRTSRSMLASRAEWQKWGVFMTRPNRRDHGGPGVAVDRAHSMDARCLTRCGASTLACLRISPGHPSGPAPSGVRGWRPSRETHRPPAPAQRSSGSRPPNR